MWRTRRALFEAASGAVARPVRLLAYSLTAALGIGLYVATLTIAATAERQVAADFDALRAVEVRISSRSAQSNWVPTDYRGRLLSLAGVEDVEMFADFGEVVVTTAPPRPNGVSRTQSARLIAVDVGGPRVVEAEIDGSSLDVVSASLDTPMALIGSRLAESLGLGRSDGVRAIWLDGEAVIVAGIIRYVARQAHLVDSVVVLYQHGLSLRSDGPSDIQLIVETAPGAASNVARQAPLALRPEEPHGLSAVAPPDPGEFRLQIEGRVRATLLAIAAAAILVEAISIGNSMALNVVSRTAEIGVRRALGALPRDVFTQIIGEATAIGLIGGVLGASLGVIGSVLVAQRVGWNPVIDPRVPLQGIAIGVLIGVVAGLLPALRASRIEPVDALRSSG